MTQEEKLRKIVETAVNDGYKICDYLSEWDVCEIYGKICISIGPDVQKIGGVPAYVPAIMSVNDLIFNHDFAKAFFGESWNLAHSLRLDNPWQFNLQKLATIPEDDRIDYLYKFIKT